MKKPFLLLFFLIFTYTLPAQKEAAVWYFGHNAGLDFNSGAPVLLEDGALFTLEGSASISDKDGNLLFYTDGITVWNRNHQPMPNGTGLKGDPSSSQSAIIVPKSDEPNLFYIFTVDDIGGPDGLQYNLVDMNLDGGLGDVTVQKNIVLQTLVSEKITAIENANGDGVWVVTKGFLNNTYYSYLVDGTGVSTIPITSNIGFAVDGVLGATINQETHGYVKASPNGKFLAAAIMGKGKVELCRFNTASGAVTDFISLQDFFDNESFGDEPYGVEFSPNSKVLYVSTKGGVYQFDVSTYDEAAIVASGVRVSPFYGLPPFAMAMQTAVDGKIYVVHSFRRYLMVINNPNVLGPGCDFVEQGVSLGTTVRSALGLPPFITSFFDVGIEADNFCLGDGTEFKIDSSEPIISISWDFGDGNTSTIENPTHNYSSAGDYTVNVTVVTATDTSNDTKEITIYEVPVASTSTNFEICTEDVNYEFDLSSKSSEIIGAQNPTDFQVQYYPILIDAQDATNPLSNTYTNTTAIETIFARIENRNNPNCFDISSFDLVVQQAPVVNILDDWIVCDTDLDGLHTFDLREKSMDILQHNDPTLFSVSYYLSQTDLDTKTNQIALDFTNTLPRTEIFWRIENNLYTSCYGNGTFFLEVIAGVTANKPTDFQICDDDNDGFSAFDLTTKEAEILGSQNASSVMVSFHLNSADAEGGNNAVSKSNFVNTVSNIQTLFVRVENSSDDSCYETTSLEVIVYDSPVLQTVTDFQHCDDDNDGVQTFDLTQKDIEILGTQPASDFTVSYHVSQTDADTNSNTISAPYQNTSNPQNIYYRIVNTSNPTCYLTDSFVLEVFDTPIANTPSPFEVCDTDETGIQTFDLSQKDNEVLNGQNATTFEVSYFATQMDADSNVNPLLKTDYSNTQLNETIYIRIANRQNSECFATTTLNIIVNPLPQPILEQTYVICPDSPELTIDGGDFESWSWRDAQNNEITTNRTLNVSSLGEYTLTVSDSSSDVTCEKTVSFEVVSSGAPEDFTTELANFSDQVQITIDVTGIGDFEYSSDGENFQDSNRLVVFPGTYTIFVRDKFLCRTISKDVIAVGYQKFFTPNNDGRHDFWNVIGAEHFPESKIFIFDRYGKLLAQLSPESKGWNGTFNGINMPSSDYWFRFENEDGNTFTGHFTLKR